jgi:predicted nucleotidyltransferase
MGVKALEGDLIENLRRAIFDVKGLVHPPNSIIAYPRFIPDPSANRKRKKALYRKIYSLTERFEFLQQNFPHYLVNDPVFGTTLCEIPVKDVVKYYRPVEKLRRIRSSKSLGALEHRALQLAELLKEKANIPWNTLGISGSIMVGLIATDSDIDPVIYGSQSCLKAHAALENLLRGKREPLRPYAQKDLRNLFEFRSKDTAMNFQDFVRTESRKVMQGKFNGTEYFVRFVKNWNETDENYGDVCYENLGYARIKATVADDSEAIFTPCKYDVERVMIIEGPRLAISEIASFRGRFCEQARTGETVVAQGKVERVRDNRRNREYFRILLGNTPSDYMVLA